MTSVKLIVIADLDGTIALCDHRRHFVEGPKKDWDSFFKECVNDTPNNPVISTLRALAESYYTIIIVSGRSADVRTQTEIWLHTHSVPYNKLYMRPEKDYTPDDVLKFKMLQDIKKDLNFADENILCFFDDRQKVVDMWRRNGFTCFQVAAGNF